MLCLLGHCYKKGLYILCNGRVCAKIWWYKATETIFRLPLFVSSTMIAVKNIVSHIAAETNLNSD